MPYYSYMYRMYTSIGNSETFLVTQKCCLHFIWKWEMIQNLKSRLSLIRAYLQKNLENWQSDHEPNNIAKYLHLTDPTSFTYIQTTKKTSIYKN